MPNFDSGPNIGGWSVRHDHGGQQLGGIRK